MAASGSSTFGKRWGHEGGALRNEINALIKEASKRSFAPSTMWQHSQKIAVYESENVPLPDYESACT